MKVLFLPDYMAANAYQRELADGLRSRGVTVAAQATGRRRLLPVLQAVRAQGRPDVLHLHWTEPYISGGRTDVSRVKAARTITELRLLRRTGTPVVWTAHDLSRHDRPIHPLEMRFNRDLFRLSSAVIVHCDAAREALLEALDLPAAAVQRVWVIPHGHYLSAYRNDITRAEARERLGVAGQGPVLAFVGWVRPYKGVGELIRAFRDLPGDELRLLIAGTPGSNEFAAEVTALAEGDPRIALHLGFVPDDDLQLYLNAADAVALPYREIFTSGSVLLAISFGRAVIAPRRGCIEETVDGAGAILYDATDPQGLPDALRRAITSDLEAMGAHNRSRADDFDWGRIAASTLDVYRSVWIDGRSASRRVDPCGRGATTRAQEPDGSQRERESPAEHAKEQEPDDASHAAQHSEQRGIAAHPQCGRVLHPCGIRRAVAPVKPGPARSTGRASMALPMLLLAGAAAGVMALPAWLDERSPSATEVAGIVPDAPADEISQTSIPSPASSSTSTRVPSPSPSPSPPPRALATPPSSSAGTGAGGDRGTALDIGPSDSLRLRRVATITGGLAPKSVVSSQTGYFVAQNMMYRHTMSVYDRDFELVRTIRDRVDLSRFDRATERTVVQGAPVEAAFSPDGASAYISQYTMYGPGFEQPGADTCHPAEERDRSFVYRIDMTTLRVDQVLPVGATPKYLAVSPDGRFLLVANWCSYDLSIFHLATAEEIRRLPIGPYPRGITFAPDARTAYIAVMGSTWIGVLDMQTLEMSRIEDVGIQPRHLVMDPAGRFLYASLDEEGSVVKIDLVTGLEVGRASTGAQPRSMDIAPDGRSLYVVEYADDSAVKIRTDTMEVIQRVETRHHPIGITYDIATRQVWIACYSGVIQVFRDV